MTNAQRRPGLPPRRHAVVRPRVDRVGHRSTKAGAPTPATLRRARHLGERTRRSTKAGAPTRHILRLLPHRAFPQGTSLGHKVGDSLPAHAARPTCIRLDRHPRLGFQPHLHDLTDPMLPTREGSPARHAFRVLGGAFPNPPADEREILAPCVRCHSKPRRSESMRTAEDSTRGARLPRSRPRAPSSKPLRSKTPCGVGRCLRSIADAPPSGMNAHTRPVLAVGRPQVEERIDTGKIKGMAPRRPAEVQLPWPFPVRRQPRWIADDRAALRNLSSVPVPLNGNIANPKNARTSTTGSTHLPVPSACDASLVWSNPSPLSFTLGAVPCRDSSSRSVDGRILPCTFTRRWCSHLIVPGPAGSKGACATSPLAST